MKKYRIDADLTIKFTKPHFIGVDHTFNFAPFKITIKAGFQFKTSFFNEQKIMAPEALF